jgi:hypothetical protein
MRKTNTLTDNITATELNNNDLICKKKYIQSVPKKKDESIAPLFIGGFSLSIHQIKWLLIGYKTA